MDRTRIPRTRHRDGRHQFLHEGRRMENSLTGAVMPKSYIEIKRTQWRYTVTLKNPTGAVVEFRRAWTIPGAHKKAQQMLQEADNPVVVMYEHDFLKLTKAVQ